MRITRFIACVLLTALLTVSASAADILTPADVEKVSGQTGLHKTPKDQSKGAGGDLNFARSDNKLVAMVMISSSMYDNWKKQYAASCEPVSNVGAEAFRTKPGAFPSFIVFRKGSTGVWIQSMGWKKDGSATLNNEQLTELARIAASRM